MLIKILLCLTLLIFTSGVGYAFASKYRKRKVFFSQFYEFNQKFIQELSYSKRPIKDFIQAYPYKSEFLALLEVYRDNLGQDNLFNEYFSSNIFLIHQENISIVNHYLLILLFQSSS